MVASAQRVISRDSMLDGSGFDPPTLLTVDVQQLI
jgi:hypothetical protein